MTTIKHTTTDSPICRTNRRWDIQDIRKWTI